MTRNITVLALLAATALPALAAQAQKRAAATTPPPEAIYWMSADTMTGMATGQMMGSGSARSLQLQLGSIHRAPAPAAEHLPPAVLQAGPSLPLTTPAGTVPPLRGAESRYDPSQVKGRMLIYWGCGEQARPGQPLTIDMAAMAAGKASPLAAMLTPASMTPPAVGRHATYGEWPNAKGRTTVPARGSLIGDHVVRGNYSPEIRFAVAGANDFLAPLTPNSAALPSGAMRVAWPSVPNALAYAATVMGARDDGTVVIWSSSEVKTAFGAFHDYLAPAEVARLLQMKALMTPATTQCAVPAEVVKAVGGAMLQMTAFGPEGNYAAPKTDPHRWAVKLRTKSTHMGMLGMEMPSLGDIAGTGEAPAGGDKPRKKRGLLRGLGKIISPIPVP